MRRQDGRGTSTSCLHYRQHTSKTCRHHSGSPPYSDADRTSSKYHVYDALTAGSRCCCDLTVALMYVAHQHSFCVRYNHPNATLRFRTALLAVIKCGLYRGLKCTTTSDLVYLRISTLSSSFLYC